MPSFREARKLSRLMTRLRTLAISARERRLRSRGYQPGAMSEHFCLWWNDNDDCIIEEMDGEYEGSEYK